jgi:hypothetical protein
MIEPEPVVKPGEKATLTYPCNFYHCQRNYFPGPRKYPAGTDVVVKKVEANYDQDHNRFQGYSYYIDLPKTWLSTIVDGFMLSPGHE